MAQQNTVELERGHTLAVVRANTSALVAAGKEHTQARAIAFRAARKVLAEKLADGVEVFRAGNYPGKIPVTERDLDQVVHNYNSFQAGRGVRYEAPAKLTHDVGRPAEGWTTRLARRGRSLVAAFRDPSDDLLNGIIEERYPNPSIELRQSFMVDGQDRGMALKATAFLGADPPAVKEVAAFSEDEDGTSIVRFTFSEWSKQPTGDTQVADENKVEHTVRVEVAPAPAAPVPSGSDVVTFSEEDVKKREQVAAQKAREEAQAEFAETQAKNAEKARCDSNAEFCEALVKDKKLRPADRGFWVGVLNALSPSLQFSETEGGDQKPLYDELKAKLSSGSKSALFSEVTPKGDKGIPAEDGDMNFGEGTKATLERIKTEKGEDSKEYKAALEGARKAQQQMGG